MLPSPVPAGPGWDEDLTWLDRDPVTAAEFEASLDRMCELDEGPGEDEDEDCNAPFTAEELAAIAELARRNPGELDAEFTGDQVAYALGESRARHLHQPDLPQARRPGRLRAQHALQGGRADVSL